MTSEWRPLLVIHLHKSKENIPKYLTLQRLRSNKSNYYILVKSLFQFNFFLNNQRISHELLRKRLTVITKSLQYYQVARDFASLMICVISECIPSLLDRI